MSDFATWFGLKSGRDDFHIQTKRDYALFFARSLIDTTIRRSIDEANRGRNPIKMVLYGDWGCGKTHTLRHLEYLLEHTSVPKGFPVFIDLPDVMAKTRFNEAQSLLLDAIGFEKVREWVRQYNARYSDAGKRIREFTSSADIEKALLTILGFGDSAQIAWEWLRGESLNANASRAVGLPPSLTQSHALVSVLRILGQMCLEFEERMLTFLVDEADNLKNVTDHDSTNHWRQCLRSLADVDNEECGLVIAGGFNDTEEMPAMLSDQQIMTRFGLSHYISLQTFQRDEATEFLKCLFVEWIDDAKRSVIISGHPSEADGESLQADTFPFTAEGLTKFSEYCCRNGGMTRPRDIQTDLHAVLNYSVDGNRHIISSVFLGTVVGS
jgi:hypothetical protein